MHFLPPGQGEELLTSTQLSCDAQYSSIAPLLAENNLSHGTESGKPIPTLKRQVSLPDPFRTYSL
jgi:hypothetical protein